MKNEFFLFSNQQKNVSGTGNVLIDSLAPFNGVVDTFITDGEEVYVSARQQFDAKRSGSLTFRFKADITNGKHDYEADSGLSISYALLEKVEGGTKITPFPAVYGSGTVAVTFDYDKGALAVGFNLEVQNSPTEPRLKAIGAFRDVSGLEHVKK
ncbi:MULTISPECIES: hypothetical protein [Pseudomonas]|jgi:hypothetical protein|uniref:Uncharacterized protein n=1 Tax=Pseudomonas fluorescens TaxID=294 RepID=A0AAE2DJB0_PSEFL|nr:MULTISPECIES: hypothetical protein [Pseudomonas fluorescens group]KIF59611.1 hypothetical protein QS95_15785 [Pseudomonas fluorescens]MBP4001856.1 hypothetical protein [Pseudomonas koreensis]QIA01682.1 hypothetical protein GZH78_05920 [Pseudomonas fluorescens]